MTLNNLTIAKQASMLQFHARPEQKRKMRNQPQNFIMDYILLAIIVIAGVLFGAYMIVTMVVL